MRKQVVFYGRVQGVGFRYSVEMIAGHHDVTGYVRNQFDGSVEVVVEGEPNMITAFLDEIRSVRGRNISSVLESVEPATGEYHDFHVAF